MATRLFGPIQGAGVSVNERQSEQPITEAALGWAAYAGMLDRGPTNELIFALSKTDAIAKTGNLTPDSTLPDAIRHYFDLAAGAGGLALVRITDGTEAASIAPLYARRAALHTQIGTLEAKNGGRWGGFAQYATGQVDDEVADISETTIDTGIETWNTDQWAGGYVELAGVTNSRYVILGNTDDGVITVASDSLMASDLLGGGDETNDRYYLVLEGRNDRGLEYEIKDGENEPNSEFSLGIHLDGAQVIRWENLSMDPDSARYWVDVVNSTDANYYVTATDSWTGAIVDNIRPANIYGTQTALTATLLTAQIHDFTIESDGGGDPTFALGTTTAVHLPQTITITMNAATTGDAVSDKYGNLGEVTLGSLFTPDMKWAPPFTVTAGMTPLASGDILTFQYYPLGADDSLINGFVYPDKLENPDKVYRIVANTHDTITVAIGNDMATDVSGGDTEFMVVALQRLNEGRDGHADVGDHNYIQAYDIDNSLFRRINGRNLGLVKFACPGVTSTNVQKAGAAFVSSGVVGAQQWRYEIPSNITTETGIESHVNTTLGRSPFGDYKVTAQSFVYVVNPEANGLQKLVPSVGMIHGREAQIAAAFGGYHKAAAGIDATLPAIVKLNTGEVLLNEEFLNPRGINVIKRNATSGSFVLWGDRTVTSSTAWKFAHQRETMNYYINVLREGFDASVFAINDKIEWAKIRTTLVGFFFSQYSRRALDNTLPFADACIIKIDTENNTSATQANGDLNVEVTVAIVNTVERLKFSIGKNGVQQVGA